MRDLRNITLLRIFDLLISFFSLIILFPLFLVIYFVCFIESGKPIFKQIRVGKNKKPFKIYKFRTMKKNTPSLASHLISKKSVTKFGKIIRHFKLDELPQIINVIKGEMSLVGPRPCLFNQNELIHYRTKYKVFNFLPGITGLAQIKKIDMSKPEKLAITDYQMNKDLNLIYYFKLLFLTFFGGGFGDKVLSR